MVSSITLLSFSGVEKSAAVVIRSASGFPANVWNKKEENFADEVMAQVKG
jgi:ribosomal protein L25 (general stress protein Ctc)